MRNAITIANSTRLPSSEDSGASAAAGSTASTAMKPPRSTATAASHNNTTGSRSFNRCISATARKPVSVDALVASRMGRNTSVGSLAPCCARYMKMLTGSRVSEDALSTRNRICALLAVSALGFSVCNSRIARRPIGVAALSRPSAFAAKLSVMRPIAGCPSGTSGIRRRNNGPSSRASASMTPARSAMRKRPSHKVNVPNRRIMTSTDSRAMSNRLAIIAANTPLSPPISQRARAAIAAVRKKPSQSRLSMRLDGSEHAKHRTADAVALAAERAVGHTRGHG